MATKAIVVLGPPASGKTTYVLERMTRGDLVVDMDLLYAAMSGLPLRDKPNALFPFVAAARDAAILRCIDDSEVGTAWIITTSESHAHGLVFRLGAALVELQVDEEERRRRLAARARKQHGVGYRGE